VDIEISEGNKKGKYHVVDGVQALAIAAAMSTRSMAILINPLVFKEDVFFANFLVRFFNSTQIQSAIERDKFPYKIFLVFSNTASNEEAHQKALKLRQIFSLINPKFDLNYFTGIIAETVPVFIRDEISAPQFVIDQILDSHFCLTRICIGPKNWVKGYLDRSVARCNVVAGIVENSSFKNRVGFNSANTAFMGATTAQLNDGVLPDRYAQDLGIHQEGQFIFSKQIEVDKDIGPFILDIRNKIDQCLS